MLIPYASQESTNLSFFFIRVLVSALSVANPVSFIKLGVPRTDFVVLETYIVEGFSINLNAFKVSKLLKRLSLLMRALRKRPEFGLQALKS